MNSEWLSFHVFYHEYMRQNTLLTEGVYPVVQALKQKNILDKWFFIRYWEGGPHIRLRLQTTCSQDVRTYTLDQIRNHLSVYPSMVSVERDKYYENHVFDGTPLTQDSLPWFEDNCVEEIPYYPEYQRYGNPRAMPYSESIFMISSEVVSRALQANPEFGQIVGLAIELTVCILSLIRENLPDAVRILEYQWRVFADPSLDIREAGVRNFVQEVVANRSKILEKHAAFQKMITDQFLMISELTDHNQQLSIITSQVHMTNNRLGVFPALEYVIFRQLAECVCEAV